MLQQSLTEVNLKVFCHGNLIEEKLVALGFDLQDHKVVLQRYEPLVIIQPGQIHPEIDIVKIVPVKLYCKPEQDRHTKADKKYHYLAPVLPDIPEYLSNRNS